MTQLPSLAPEQILKLLAEHGIDISRHDERHLNVTQRHPLSAADRALIRNNKPALLAYLERIETEQRSAPAAGRDTPGDALLETAREFAAERRVEAGPAIPCSWCAGVLFWRYGDSWRCWSCVDYGREQAVCVVMVDGSPFPVWLDHERYWLDGERPPKSG